MHHRGSRKLKLTFAVFILSLIITQVRGQTALEIAVGTTKIKPTIDGQWQQGEWDNAIEYKFAKGLPRPPTNPAFIRMTHDSSNLYGIIDVPSDNGTTFQLMNGNAIFGLSYVIFYSGTVLNPTDKSQIHTYVQLAVNRTHVSVAVDCNGLCDVESIIANSQGATSLSGTIHSSTKHRVWEFSIPVYVVKPSLSSNSKIGFEVIVSDSAGNLLYLVDLAQHADLSFVGTPVPELTGEIILPVMLITPVILLFGYHRRRAK
jgi:hypothetical protein